MSAVAPPGTGELTKEQLLEAYRVMRTIRDFEERLHTEFATGEIPGFVHLYAGEEAIAAGVCAHLGTDDYVASTHRGHGHAIAKGCDVEGDDGRDLRQARPGSATARAARCTSPTCRQGMLGANGIVGGGPPLVCGVGLTAKVRGTDQVGVSFTGDGGSNQGTFLESLNLAAAWHLPVVFVVENNGYAESTSSNYHQSGIDVAKRADGFGLPGVIVDGFDFFAVHEAAGEAIARARSGGGPTLLECKVDALLRPLRGRPADLPRRRRGRGPAARARLPGRVRPAGDRRPGSSRRTELGAIDEAARRLIDEAVAEAKAAPDPTAADVLTDVYVRY